MSKLFAKRKLFATRSALTAASFIVVAAALQPAVAQEHSSAKDEPTVSARLAPGSASSTSGTAQRNDGALRAKATESAKPMRPDMPEMKIMDYSLIFPETD